MNRNFSLLVYFFASIIIISFFAKSLDIFLSRTEPVEDPVYAEVLRGEKGELKYASGSCNDDVDCSPTGCSLEVCGAEGVITTCEVKEDAPGDNYRCGCFENTCAWIAK